MFKAISRVFQKPNATELAVRELAEARKELLTAQTGRDYAEAMVKYHTDRISRLEMTVLIAK